MYKESKEIVVGKIRINKMLINGDISEVKNWKTKKKNELDVEVSNVLIEATFYVGINKITQENYRIFFARWTAWEHLTGARLWDGPDKPAYITLNQVKEWIGLKSDARELTASEFEKFIIDKFSLYENSKCTNLL